MSELLGKPTLISRATGKFIPWLVLMAESEEELKSLLMKVKSEGEVAQSCPTLCDPMDCSPPGSSARGIFQARVLECIVIAFSRVIFPTQGSNLGLLHCRQILYCLNHQEA